MSCQRHRQANEVGPQNGIHNLFTDGLTHLGGRLEDLHSRSRYHCGESFAQLLVWSLLFGIMNMATLQSLIGGFINTVPINSDIGWCDSTVNPTMGCDGCELWDKIRKTCYAGLLHKRFGGVNPGFAPRFEEVTLFPERMAKAAKWKDLRGQIRPTKPWIPPWLARTIFMFDMSDGFSKAVSFEFLKKEVIDTVKSPLGQRHMWLWLTKRPGRMARFSRWIGESWPRNVAVGTSITTQKTTSRIDELLEVGDADTVRLLSVEPQGDQLDLQPWLPRMHWLIQGGESGRNARPFRLEWAYEMIDQCREHNVPYFLKQLGSHVISDGQRISFNDSSASDWSEWPEDLRIREFPTEFSLEEA